MNRLRQLREQNHLSLSKLGEKLGMSAAVLGNYERGDREPKVDIWKKIANFFDVDTAYLMGLSDIDSTTLQKLNLKVSEGGEVQSYVPVAELRQQIEDLKKENQDLKETIASIAMFADEALKNS